MTNVNISQEAQEAISNTPGAEMIKNSSGMWDIKLQVSRYQKPEQGGSTSVRTGVFYLPEVKSPYEKYYRKNKIGYGGNQYITGTITLHTPYIVKAGTGGLGPQKAYINLIGMDEYKALKDDIFNMVITRAPWGRTPNHMVVEEWVQELLDKYDCDVDLSYDIVRHCTQGNTLRYALQENIIAHTLRDKGYDSILSYSKSGGLPRLSEIFDLRQMEYPDESGFVVEQVHHMITLYKTFEDMSSPKYKKYDLRKEILDFDSAYHGAEYYSLHDDPDDSYHFDHYQKSNRWYELMFTNNGRGLTKSEMAEMIRLSDDLRQDYDIR